jgi:hypothetical protein
MARLKPGLILDQTEDVVTRNRRFSADPAPAPPCMSQDSAAEGEAVDRMRIASTSPFHIDRWNGRGVWRGAVMGSLPLFDGGALGGASRATVTCEGKRRDGRRRR